MFSGLQFYAGIVVGVIATALISIAVMTVYVIPKAKSEGQALYIAKQAAESQKAELERKGDDKKLRGMSDYDLCVSALGRVPDCEPLKM